MSKTVISSTTAYSTPAHLLQRYDLRTVGRLLSDDGATTLTQAQILASTVLASFQLEASGRAEAACLRGGRYTAADLLALQTPTMTAGGELLAGLVDDLSMWRLWRRRPQKEAQEPAAVKDAFAMLEELETGAMVFGFQETADAGRIEHARMSPRQVIARNGVEQQMRRYFGSRRADTDGANAGPFP